MTNRKHRTPDEIEERKEYCAAACVFVDEICKDADMRGVPHSDVAQSIAVALTCRNPSLAGKVLEAVKMAILQVPVTKIITAPAGTTVN